MKKTVYILLFTFSLIPGLLQAQLVVTKGSDIAMTPEQFVNTYLMGSGVTVIAGSVKFNGNAGPINGNATAIANQIGNFTTSGGAQTKLGLAGGIILSSGNVANAVTGACVPANCPPASGTTNSGSDVDLNVLMAPASSRDKSILEFDFKPETDVVTFRYVFSSEEFDQYCNQFNDAFGFLISGPGCGTTPPNIFTNNAENIALLPSTTNYVTINNICSNALLYSWCNLMDLQCRNGSGPEFSYNRFTFVFTATRSVTPCQIYHMKIAIGDAGDTQYDSGVFLEQNSFSSNNVTFNNTYSIPTLGDNAIEGCSNVTVGFEIGAPKATDFLINYTIGGSATPDGPSVPNPDYGITPTPSGTAFPTSVTIPAGQTQTSILLFPYQDLNDLEGDETATFTVTNTNCSGSNSNTNTIVIKNNVVLTANINAAPAVCVGNQVTLTAVPTGGQPSYAFSWNDGATENPHTVTPVIGTNNFSVNITDGCSASANNTASVFANSLPLINFPAFPPICINTAPFVLNNATPSGGTYSGPGVNSSTGIFDPALAGLGAHLLSYVYTDLNTCTNTATRTITVVDKPVITLPVFQPVCLNASPLTLSGGMPSGGNYSGPGVTGGSFNPMLAGIGTHSITYTYTDANSCTNSATNNIEVLALPVITFSNMPDVCIDLAPFILSAASPAGGTYSGPGVSAGMFNPAVAGVGTHTLTYSYTDGNNCTNTNTRSITVKALPVVSLQPLLPVCVSGPAFPLGGGLPGGGTFSGPGVSAGIFNPAAAGVGSHLITYTYTDGNGCVNFASRSIQVNALPVVTLANFQGTCFNTPAFPLSGGNPVGGTYSGPGVSAGVFSPAIAGVGSHTITYTYTDGNTCVNSTSKNIQVNALPLVDFSGPVVPQAVCQDYPTPSRYQIAPNPLTTFTWSIPPPFTAKGTVTPVAGFPNMADVNWTAPGPAQLKLQGLTNNGCLDSKTKDIIINAKPVVTLPLCFDQVTTTNAKPFRLKGGTPLGAGGKYYIDGTLVAGNVLDPSGLGAGNHTVSFTYTDANTCLATASQTIVVGPSNALYQCVNNTFTDPRNPDNSTNKYPTSQVTANGRTTCWMIRNLNWGTSVSSVLQQTDNCIVERYCPPNDNSCSSYGSLFQWDELMQYGSTPAWSKGVCPPGWHVPTSLEWQDLIDANQGNGIAAGALKNLILPSGFRALLNGMYYLNTSWAFTSADNLKATMFWTSTLAGSKPAARGINFPNPSVSYYECNKINAFPVRCVKD